MKKKTYLGRGLARVLLLLFSLFARLRVLNRRALCASDLGGGSGVLLGGLPGHGGRLSLHDVDLVRELLLSLDSALRGFSGLAGASLLALLVVLVKLVPVVEEEERRRKRGCIRGGG